MTKELTEKHVGGTQNCRCEEYEKARVQLKNGLRYRGKYRDAFSEKLEKK